MTSAEVFKNVVKMFWKELLFLTVENCWRVSGQICETTKIEQ